MSEAPCRRRCAVELAAFREERRTRRQQRPTRSEESTMQPCRLIPGRARGTRQVSGAGCPAPGTTRRDTPRGSQDTPVAEKRRTNLLRPGGGRHITVVRHKREASPKACEGLRRSGFGPVTERISHLGEGSKPRHPGFGRGFASKLRPTHTWPELHPLFGLRSRSGRPFDGAFTRSRLDDLVFLPRARDPPKCGSLCSRRVAFTRSENKAARSHGRSGAWADSFVAPRVAQ